MLSIGTAFYDLKNALLPLYDAQEAAAIAHEVLEELTGWGKMERLMRKDETLSPEAANRFEAMKAELQTGRPLQYVLGYAWFMDRRLEVDENVLIPRPETEELVQWILNDVMATTQNPSILDVGTGSGCIPISLKLGLPQATVTSADISEGALAMAQKNTRSLQADISFRHLDFLNQEHWSKLGLYDVIVSNPPYIPEAELTTLHTNVREFEPHSALFVPDNDPLLFYRAIAIFGQKHLKENGAIYCELHIEYAEDAEALFLSHGYSSVELRRDLHGNWRMLKVMRQ